MAKERLKSPRTRLFVALDLPDAVRESLAAWQGEIAAREEGLRPVSADSLHVTLCFLGYQAEKDVERIAGIVLGTAPGPVAMRLEPDPVPVPQSRPRLFAVDAPSEGAVAVYEDLAERLADAGFYEREKRPFWSHVTVARVRPEKGSRRGRGRRGRSRPRRLAGAPGPLPADALGPFSAVRVRLYRSHLRPSGAEYAPVADLTLPPAEAEKR